MATLLLLVTRLNFLLRLKWPPFFCFQKAQNGVKNCYKGIGFFLLKYLCRFLTEKRRTKYLIPTRPTSYSAFASFTKYRWTWNVKPNFPFPMHKMTSHTVKILTSIKDVEMSFFKIIAWYFFFFPKKIKECAGRDEDLNAIKTVNLIIEAHIHFLAKMFRERLGDLCLSAKQCHLAIFFFYPKKIRDPWIGQHTWISKIYKSIIRENIVVIFYICALK